MPEHRPVMLVILDGWGWREDPTDNAVRQARTPNFNELWRSCPHAFLRTSGRNVGLPPHNSARRCVQGRWAPTRETAPDLGARQN